jgi:gliding motility-associated lipoprotein GldH
MSLKSSFVYLLLALAFISCDKKRVFDEYKSIGKSWDKDSIVSFTLPKLDTTKQYNMYVNLRDNNNYPFSNMFLIVSLEAPDGLTKVDTLEYQMADPDGTLLGNGFTDVKESKLFYKERIKVKSGEYKVHIRQALRKTGAVGGVDKLEGITEVGFRVEKLD